MRVIVSFVDGTVVVDGVGRKVALPDVPYLQHLSWDGETGVLVFDEGDPVYFTDDEYAPYVTAWETAPEPEPPPLPPWEDEPELPLPLPRNAIPLAEPDPPGPIPPPEDPLLPWDAPPPPGVEPVPPTEEKP